MRVYKGYGISLSNQHGLRGEGGLHFNWCHGIAAGVGISYNCVSVLTTFFIF